MQMYSWGWQLNDLLFDDSIEMITVFQVNIKCQPNSFHSNDKGNVIAVNQMNIQLVQLICRKVHSFQTRGLGCPSRGFSAVGKQFLILQNFCWENFVCGAPGSCSGALRQCSVFIYFPNLSGGGYSSQWEKPGLVSLEESNS